MTAKPTLAEITSAAVDALKRGDNVRAFDLSCIALHDPKAGHLPRAIFSQSVSSLKLLKHDPVIRNALLAFFDHNRVDYSRVFKIFLYVVSFDPIFQDVLEAVKARHVKIDDWRRLETPLNDPLMTVALRKIIMRNPGYEVFFRNVRKLLLLELWPQGILKTKNLNFICALAEQCFANEYVYAVTEEEERAVAELPRDNALAVAILGCYKALSEEAINPKLSGVAAFRSMMTVQVSEPQREKELALTIKSAGVIDNTVSKDVQAMYEENPYPRWSSIDLPLKARTEITGSMLIAGCGTGRTVTQAGQTLPKVEISACDITRRSLAYAMRMAEKFGNDNVAFEQRDIMNLGAMKKTFDFVECSGVLHHMADPVAGWKELVSRLKSDGIMLICLYSTMARTEVKRVRNHIAERELEPTADAIRKLRAEIIDDKEHPLQGITRSRDFYSLSETRDLVFHIQETTYILPEIGKIIDGLGLELHRFLTPDQKTAKLYAEKYPADPSMANLNNWHAFEQENPSTFFGMYKMLFKRKGANVSEAARALAKVAEGG